MEVLFSQAYKVLEKLAFLSHVLESLGIVLESLGISYWSTDNLRKGDSPSPPKDGQRWAVKVKWQIYLTQNLSISLVWENGLYFSEKWEFGSKNLVRALWVTQTETVWYTVFIPLPHLQAASSFNAQCTQNVDPGEEKYPSTPTRTQIHNLSITSPAL